MVLLAQLQQKRLFRTAVLHKVFSCCVRSGVNKLRLVHFARSAVSKAFCHRSLHSKNVSFRANALKQSFFYVHSLGAVQAGRLPASLAQSQ